MSANDRSTSASRWQRIRLVIKVVELRLRFIALMAVTGWVFANWEMFWNRFEKWNRPASANVVSASGIEYYCPMHPQVVQGESGSCPICGMPLARRKKGEPEPLGEGVIARVALTPGQVEQAGIRTVEVGYAAISETITTVGDVGFDERRLATIVSKAAGKSRVEKLHANFTGQEVRAGDPLAELYSPELHQAIEELLTAFRRARAESGRASAAALELLGDRRDLVRLAAEKLRRWGLQQAQIDEILAKGKGDAIIPILAPIGGTIVKKNVVEGQEVPEGFSMFEIAELSRVWIRGRVYEHQLSRIREGQDVEATVEAFPGQAFRGSVAFIQPMLDSETRTVEVRFDVENTGRSLRPGMFATMTLKSPVANRSAFRARLAEFPTNHGHELTVAEQKNCPVTRAKLGSMGDPIPVEVAGRKVWTCCGACPPKLKASPASYLSRIEPPPADQVLSVPESAVIDTGTRKVVYVEAAPGVYEGRSVVLGPRVIDRFPVLEGLEPGEKVAARGAFLIDAESRLNPSTVAASHGPHGGDTHD